MRKSNAAVAGVLAAVLVAPTVAVASAPEALPALEGGTAEGWLEVAKERTEMRYAWVLGEAGDGASGELLVVLADRPLPDEAIADPEVRSDLAARDEGIALAVRLPEGADELEVWFYHPRLPRGLSLRGLTRFARESDSSVRLEGRLVSSSPGTPFEVWFSAPIVRSETATWPEIEAEARELPPDRSFEEILRDGDADELELALDQGADLEHVGSGGASALAIAAEAGNVVAIARLVTAGAVVDARADRAALTPLMIAAGQPSTETVAALLAAGANPKLRTSSGFTALMHAVVENRIDNARLLLAAGADLERDRTTLVKIATDKGFAEMTALLAAPPPPAPTPEP